MKAVIQRVVDASVTVDGITKGKIDSGLLVYLGVAHNDSESDADRLAEKTAYLRIFNDNEGKMNLSVKDLAENNKLSSSGELPVIGVLAVSQFTLLADTRKGRRPSWSYRQTGTGEVSKYGAAAPEKAKQLYEYFLNAVRKHGLVCESGEFQAHMMVSYINDGPVTIILDTKE